ncbi:MAG: hypothetical protein KF777_14870 [Planctomycetaceae bacterium]|nr:hypothetical protein [Planctomycetaceae bacterium]
MGHRLKPTERASRHLDDLVDSLRGAFALVEADAEKGSAIVGDMIAHFLKVKDGYSRWKTPPPQAAEIDALIARFESLREQAAFITLANDESDDDRRISFNLVPGEDIIMGYATPRHEAVVTALTKRVADVLGYEMTVL